MSTTTTTQTTATRTEQKIQSKLEDSREFILRIYNVCLPYYNAIANTIEIAWRYPEFRLGVYIFGLASFIPLAIFLLFMTVVVISTTIFVSFVWTFFVFSALAIGLIVLVPILIGISIVVGLLILGYQVYQYLLRIKQNK